MSVLQFPTGRITSPEPTGLLTCGCGSTWFELYEVDDDGAKVHGAVVLNEAGNVTGYSGTPHCMECGRTKLP